jgi:hypothetical protein
MKKNKNSALPASRTGAIDEARRRFLKQFLASTGAATYALASGKGVRNAFAEASMQERNLIVIHSQGGWDSFWFHNDYPKAWGPKDLGGERPRIQPELSSTGGIVQVQHYGYTERAKPKFLIPYANDHFLGIGARNVLGDSAADFFRDVCVWKGIASGGAHDIPNQTILHGNLSSYSISFSALAAAHFAQNYNRKPLHYVQTSKSPTDFGAQWAMARGDQVPLNIPDLASLEAITSPTANDLQDRSRFGLVSQSVARLGEEIGKSEFSLRRSQEVYQQFVSYFRGALAIMQLGSEVGAFKTLWDQYCAEAREKILSLYEDPFREQVSNDISVSYLGANYNKTFSFLPGAGDAIGWKTPIESQSGPTWSTVRSTMFGFALAEFLINRNLSSVVDVLGAGVDAHDKNDADLVLQTLNYVGFKRLIQALDRSGKLSHTTVVMFTEFDRSGNLGTDVGYDWRGTEHSDTASILLAGAGVKRGQVLGAAKSDGDASPFKSFPQISGSPLPIDLSTGLPSQTGTVIGHMAVFPTLMAILGVPVPANQLTDQKAIPGLIG